MIVLLEKNESINGAETSLPIKEGEALEIFFEKIEKYKEKNLILRYNKK